MNREVQILPPGAMPAVTLQPQYAGGTDRIDIRSSLMFFRRRLGMIAIILLLSLLDGALLTLRQPVLYVAQAVVALNASDEQLAAGTGVPQGQGAPQPNDAYVDTQVEIIRSRALAARVADALGLVDDRDFNPALQTGHGGLLARLGLGGGKPAAPPTRADLERAAIDELQSHVSAERTGATLALQIKYEAHDAEDAARIANQYARAFSQWELRSIQSRNKGSAELLSGRLKELREQAHADTQALQEYRIRNNLLSTSGASLTEQEISSYNQQVANARAQAAEDQARLDTARAQLRSGSAGDDVGEALGSNVIGSLRARVAQVGGEVANLEARYGPDHPQLIRAKSELAELNRQIQAEISRVISNLEAKARVSSQRLESLTATLAHARGALSQNNEAMVGLDELERRAQTSQALYESYLNGYKELVAQEGTERPNAKVLSLAEVPRRPASPNLPMNLALAFAVGLGLALGAAFLAETLFSGLTTSEEVEDRLRTHYLGAIPALRSVSKRSRQPIAAVVDEPHSAFAESFRSLRTSIDQAMSGPVQVVAITSALPKEGKTTTATCLARSVALGGERAVLVDCDLRRRGATRFIQPPASHPGLVEVLTSRATLQDALLMDRDTGLAVLPIQPEQDEVGALLTGPEFDRVIGELRTRFDYIVLDLPPVLPIAAARVLATRADAAVLAVRWRNTAEQAARSALDQLPGDRINIAGVALTRMNMRRQAKFGYGDSAYYYKKYEQYYLK